VWNKYPHEKLLGLFPAGGMRGTIEEWYAPKDGNGPFVFAKTGHAQRPLSEWLRAHTRGQDADIQLHAQNFAGSNREWKSEMDRILRQISR
jgi:hypothetical protein